MEFQNNNIGSVSASFKGLALNKTSSQIEEGMVTHAEHSSIEGIDESSIMYTNLPSTVFITSFKPDYTVIGACKINPEQTIYFLHNSITKENEIGHLIYDWHLLEELTEDEETNKQLLDRTHARYYTIATGSCLNFSLVSPILFSSFKPHLKDFRLYWTDGVNPMRYVILKQEEETKLLKLHVDQIESGSTSIINCDTIRILKSVKRPKIKIEEILEDGSLPVGTYQFGIAYSNNQGTLLSSVFNITQPISIIEDSYYSNNVFGSSTGPTTNKSIRLNFNNFDSKFKYFNLIVLQTIAGATLAHVVGTFSTSMESYTYTGTNVSPISLQEVLAKRPYYKTSRILKEVNKKLLLGKLTQRSTPNLQPFMSLIKPKWEARLINADDPKQNYKNGETVANKRQYMSDEVYPLGIKFIYNTGDETPVYHIPGRSKQSFDSTLVDPSDQIKLDDCDFQETLNEAWQLYNTATIEYKYEGELNKCSDQVYAYGEFSYWESQLTYPNNPTIWGDLAGQPIRHHKFPDSSIIPHFLTYKTFNSSINYVLPKGIKIDSLEVSNVLQAAVSSGTVSIEDIRDITEYVIVRGNRVNNKSVLAKGLLYDVWAHYKEEEKRNYLYSNYPYNDLNDDPYLIKGQYSTAPANITNNKLYDQMKEFMNRALIRIRQYTPNSPWPGWWNNGNPDYTNLSIMVRQTFTPGNLTAYVQQLKQHARFIEEYKNGATFNEYPLAYSNIEREWVNDTGVLISLFALSRAMFGMYAKGGYPNTINAENFQTHPYSLSGKHNDKFNFVSPDTSFNRPALGNILKIDGEMTGTSIGHFIQVEDHAKYKIFKPLASASFILSGFALSVLDSDKNTPTAEQAVKGVEMTRFLKELTELATPFYNYAWQYNSVGVYENLNIAQKGSRVRLLNNSQYIRPGINNVGEPELYNNFNRESSVYLRTNTMLSPTQMVDNSRFLFSQANTTKPEDIVQRNIASHYATIKRLQPNQYGTINDIEYLRASDTISLSEQPSTIYGGDTFIGRFATKRKHPFFIQDRKGFEDNASVNYSALGNVATPRFYIDTSRNVLGDTLNSFFTGANPEAIADKIVDFMKALAEQIANTAFASLDKVTNSMVLEQGMMYLYSYGIPYFFVESDINVELRHKGLNPHEDFYPSIGGGIPDKWLHDITIDHDNVYLYNRDYSKQHKEDPSLTLPLSFNPDEEITFLKNRVIYSDESFDEESEDKWLVFKANNYHDFNLNLGTLTNLIALENSKVGVAFDNNIQIFNSYITLQSNSIQDVIAGTGALFTQVPMEFTNIPSGFAGTQNHNSIATEFGTIWIDAKRGQIFSLKNQIDILTVENDTWFKQHLPFKILKTIPSANIDNPYHPNNPLGFATVYDNRNHIIYITKHDYEPLVSGTIYNASTHKFYIPKPLTDDSNLPYIEVSLTDPTYFCNKSFTISFSMKYKKLLSFHRFIPNFYVSNNQSFEASIKGKLYEFNKQFQSYQYIGGKVLPFVVEYPYYHSGNENVISNVVLYCKAYKYNNDTDYVEDNNVMFNKSIVYTHNQCSGILNLVRKSESNDDLAINLPRFNYNSIDICYSNYDHVNIFNDIWNMKSNNLPVFKDMCTGVLKEFNQQSVDYMQDTDVLERIRNRETFVRMIQDSTTAYKLQSHFALMKGVKS